MAQRLTRKSPAPEEGLNVAMAYCEDEIRFYDGAFEYNHKRWKRWQTVAICFGVIGTIAATIQTHQLPPDLVGLIRAAPVAIASIATGILGSFSFQAEAMRQGITSDSLQGERTRFLAGAAPYERSKPERLSEFLNNIRSIISAEQAGWETTLSNQNSKKPKV